MKIQCIYCGQVNDFSSDDIDDIQECPNCNAELIINEEDAWYLEGERNQ